MEEDPEFEVSAAKSITDAGNGVIISDDERTKLDGLNLQALVPSGTILAFGGTEVPAGWLACDGSSLSKTEFVNLYEAIGGNWGEETTNFNLPDLRGYFLRGVDGISGTDPDASSRTALKTGGNTGNAVGSYQEDEFESHTHEMPNGGAFLVTVTSNPTADLSGNNDDSQFFNETAARGGNETRPKNAYVNYIIKI